MQEKRTVTELIKNTNTGISFRTTNTIKTHLKQKSGIDDI
jgi:hypothetical protein